MDEKLAALLIREIGIYTPGSFVRLANGEIGIVIKRAFCVGGETVEPQVCALTSPRGGYYDHYPMRDTATDIYKITGICDPDQIDTPAQLPKLWGYN